MLKRMRREPASQSALSRCFFALGNFISLHFHRVLTAAARHSLAHGAREPKPAGARASNGQAADDQTRSITMAMPWPTPMHIVHSA